MTQLLSSKALPELSGVRAHATPQFERRFEAQRAWRKALAWTALLLWGAALGAAVYDSVWGSGQAGYGPWAAAGLAFLVLWMLVVTMTGPSAVRVGDGGVGWERSGRLQRWAWCDLRLIRLEGEHLQVQGPDGTLNLSLEDYPDACSWLLREARQRVPKLVALDVQLQAQLENRAKSAGVSLSVEPEPVTGKRCRASGSLITFEPDARFCLRCGALYHRQSLPAHCLCCQAQLK